MRRRRRHHADGNSATVSLGSGDAYNIPVEVIETTTPILLCEKFALQERSAGVGGNGQQELADALTGLRPPARGSIAIDGAELAGRGVPAFRRRGMRAVPAGEYGSPLLVRRRAMRTAAQAIEAYSIHGTAPGTAARLLSGGNAQKLLLARELRGEASVLIAHSPTRGLDVSACRTVHDLLQGAADADTACVLISEDLEEVLALPTTIAVISRGSLLGLLTGVQHPSASEIRSRMDNLLKDHS